MDPWAAKDSLRPRAPSFAFGKAGRAPQTPETDRAASVTTAPLSEARTARYDFTEPRRDLGVMQWRAEDGDAEAARRRRERFRRIAEARREAMAALRTAFVGCGANGGPGGLAAGLDAAIVPRRPAWGFGLPPSAQPPGRVPDVADAEGDTGAPILAPVPDLDVVRPRLGGAPDFGRATGRQAADTRRRRDRHQVRRNPNRIHETP